MAAVLRKMDSVKGIDYLEPWKIEIAGIPRHQPQFMMQSGCSKKAVYGRDCPPNFCKQPAPPIGYGNVYREHPTLKPCRELMLQPEAQFLPAPSVRQGFNSFADFPDCQDANEERFTRELIEP